MRTRQGRRDLVAIALALGLSLSIPGIAVPARDHQGEGHGLSQSDPVGVTTPLPPRRPSSLTQQIEPADGKGVNGPAEAHPSSCIRAFDERGGVVLPSDSAGTGECTIEDPVTFQKLVMPDGSRVELDSAITVRCPFALELLAWVRDDLAALASRENARLAKLSGVGGYACRARNGDATAPISEHASGNALDVGGLLMQDGRSVTFAGKEPLSRSTREAVQKSACQRFTTVLGPGADSSHKDHLHLDMRQRPRGFRICQWVVE